MATDRVDDLIEWPVVTSFSRIGYAARSRREGWNALDDHDLTGRRILLTGATSGLGRAAAGQLARAGAGLVLLGRDRARLERTRDDITPTSGPGPLDIVVADTGDLERIRAVAGELVASGPLDTIIHNAGALEPERQTSPDGFEATVASQVLGPFLLTSLLLDHLGATAPGRVLTMSSGGMYTAGLTVDGLQMGSDYRGTEQYARAKRAQVTLNEMWAERHGERGVVFHALHPGWADTPGVRRSLPWFRRVVGPLLRTPEQGADTLVWLTADDGEPLSTNGLFWHDRRPRPIHRMASTRRTDTEDRRRRLWEWCVENTGADPST